MSPPRAIRTEGEATAETGLHFSRLCLTQGQLDLLRQPDYDHRGSGIVHLCAPPGCGKTLMLALKGRQWLNQGRHVHVVSMDNTARAVSSQLARTLRQDQRTAAAVTTHYVDIKDSNSDIPPLVTTLAGVPGPAAVLVDEAGGYEFAGLCRDLHRAAPNTCLWGAGMFTLLIPPPCVRVVDWLTTPLRCPPSVQRQVASSRVIGGTLTLAYRQEAWPSPTEGPDVRWLQHDGQPGHGEDGPEDCLQCGLEVGHLLHNLRDRQSGLEWRDMVILCKNTSLATGLPQGLRQRGVPVAVLDYSTATPQQLEDLGAALTDQVTVTDRSCVRGLERRVVVGVGETMYDRTYVMSRCTGLLVWIGTPSDD